MSDLVTKIHHSLITWCVYYVICDMLHSYIGISLPEGQTEVLPWGKGALAVADIATWENYTAVLYDMKL